MPNVFVCSVDDMFPLNTHTNFVVATKMTAFLWEPCLLASPYEGGIVARA